MYFPRDIVWSPFVSFGLSYHVHDSFGRGGLFLGDHYIVMIDSISSHILCYAIICGSIRYNLRGQNEIIEQLHYALKVVIDRLHNKKTKRRVGIKGDMHIPEEAVPNVSSILL